MHVRSFEISGVADTDLRRLFIAASGATNAQMVMASREADTINVDVVAAGGGNADSASQLATAQRATELLRGFAERHALIISDI